METPPPTQSKSAYDGFFEALDHQGERIFKVEGVLPIRDYMIDTTKWGLLRRSNRIFRSPSRTVSASSVATPVGGDSTIDQKGPGPVRTPANKTKNSRAVPYPQRLAGSKRRQQVGGCGIPPEGLAILQAPYKAKRPGYDCLQCGEPPTSDTCTIECYLDFRAHHFAAAQAKIEIRQTAPGPHATGLGVFVRADQTIAEDEWLGEYLGELLPASAPEAEESAYAFELPGHRPSGVKPVVIDAQTHGNWTRFINSACEPNVSATPEQIGKVRIVAFRAKRTIYPGEQVFINYGKEYFNSRNLQCCCDVKPGPHPPRSKK